MRRLLILIMVLGVACSKDATPEPPHKQGVRAIVVSEGQYGFSSGELMSLDHDGTLSYDLFSGANGRKIGDIPQSITEIGDNLYIPVNNDNCIEVINKESYELIETMTIPTKCVPMFVKHLGGDIIAMSDQTSAAIPGAVAMSNIFVLNINHSNPDRDIVVSTIEMPVPTFQMEIADQKLFVGCEELSIFDLDNLTTEGRRIVANSEGRPLSTLSKFTLDRSGNLWAMCSDMLYCIDPITEEIVQTVDLKWIEDCKFIDIDPSRRYLYITSDCQFSDGLWGVNVYRVDTEKPTSPIIPIFSHNQKDSWTTYGMQVSPEGTIFIIRALYGSILRSRVYEYNAAGEIQHYYNDFYDKPQPYFSAGIFSCFVHFVAE